MKDISSAVKERILILDGAMGTMLQKVGLTGNSESFCLTHPDAIEKIHRAYIDAGADIIETNSFSANSISQAEYGMSDKAYEMAVAAARIARKAADSAGRDVWVAGSIGPTGKSLSLAQDINDPTFRPYGFDDMADAFEQQIRGLLDGGVDLLLMETCFDALNTKAAIYALERIGASVPVMISVSCGDRSGRTLTGQTMEGFYRAVQHAPLLSFGLNCSLGGNDLYPLIEEVSQWAGCAVSCYPNAGLPNEMGEYDESPERTASHVRKMAEAGLVNIVGGCCGTTPEHIKAIAEAVKGLAPRSFSQSNEPLVVSGLEAVRIDKKHSNFTNIGERTNVAGSRKFAKLIAAEDYDTALQVAAGQIEGGASVIDINMDDAMLDSTREMSRFLRHISNDPAVSKAAIMIDSSHWETIVEGLKNAQGKCIVNSISLKEGEESFIAKARQIKALGAAVVVMAFDEEGQATTYERKISICERAYKLLTEKVGMNPHDIIFDVNVLSIGTGIAEHALYGVDFIEAVRWIKKNLPGALTSGGISNLSFAFRGNNQVREAMHSVFLYHAISAGLDMGIVNPGMLKVYDDIEPSLLKAVEDVILNKDEGATERLIAKAQEALAADVQTGEATAEAVSGSAAERLANALIKGGSSTLEADLMECLSEFGSASAVIEGPLMDGMAKVGELFGDGKMFLPQVVKSAKVMKNAVAILQPYIEAAAGPEASDKPKVVIATVKGDVHDIGKNITAIVLSCNGFEVIDLGVMVPKETILAKADEVSADLIFASGLITPSLHQMEELCRQMSARGMTTPLFIGGATTSALHTAVKLAPLYEHVFYRADASASAVLASRMISDRAQCEAEEHKAQQKLRELYASGGQKTSEDKPSSYLPNTYLHGKHFEDIPAREIGIDEVMPYFDWKMFQAVWGIKADTDPRSPQLRKLLSDGVALIEELKQRGGCRIMLSARFDACHTEENWIVSESYKLPMLRQYGNGTKSLADFVAPINYGFDSPMGMFAISVHRAHPVGKCDCAACSADYEPLLERSIRVCLAEAASSWLDSQLLASCPEGIKLIKPAAGYASCPDHTLKRDILALLPGIEKLGIQLTDSCAMIPDASICGLIFAHPEACYPDIRRIPQAAIDAYARQRGMSADEQSAFLSHLA
ncbi:MAG: methionine synthase [Bacteroidales bacterium]|nr:methionine synthase [Bacteroidales bacterium]